MAKRKSVPSEPGGKPAHSKARNAPALGPPLVLIHLLSILYGYLVAIYLLISIVLNRSAFFAKKRREIRPQCLDDPSLGIRHQFDQLDQIKVHYVSAGDPSKQLMLFVHGFPEFWYSWRHQIKEFAKDFFVVAIDQRGYGESDKPNGIENYTIDKMVDDIQQLLESLGKTDIILVGHDWGGAITWNFAARYGNYLDKLVILNAPHPLKFRAVRKRSLKQFLMSWYMLFFNLPYLPELALAANDYYSLDFSFRTAAGRPLMTDDQIEAYKYTFHKNSFTAPLNYYRAVIRQYPTTPLDSYRVEVPTLVIWAKGDKYLSEQLAAPHSYVSQLTVKYIDNCSHWVQMEEPSLVNQYIRQFLSDN